MDDRNPRADKPVYAYEVRTSDGVLYRAEGTSLTWDDDWVTLYGGPTSDLVLRVRTADVRAVRKADEPAETPQRWATPSFRRPTVQQEVHLSEASLRRVVSEADAEIRRGVLRHEQARR